MDYLAALRSFVRSVDLGSFSKAAAEDGTQVSTVSRYVSGLEADLGVALLNRSTHGLHLTEAGTTFYQRVAPILVDVAQARAAATSLNQHPQGLLRINIPGAFGRRHVMPHLPLFLSAYPDIRIDATLTEASVDLIESGTDLAVRIGALADSTLIARRLAPHRRVLVASRAYLEAHGRLAGPSDLVDHDCLLFSPNPVDVWYFHDDARPDSAREQRVKVSGRVRANDSEALLSAALGGLGIACLPTWIVGEDLRSGALEALLTPWEPRLWGGPVRAIWGVYPPKKIVSPKVRAFLDFLTRQFGDPPYWQL